MADDRSDADTEQDHDLEGADAATPTAANGRTTDFDVFLSHNSRDKPSVERLAEKLKRSGLEPWLDKWCLTPGGNWQNELSDGIRASRACAFFIGPHGEGAWAREELHVALDRAAKDRDFRLFLVLLPGVEEPFDTTSLPPFLSTRTWVDLRKGIEDTRSFQSLLNAIKGIPLGPEATIEPRDDICPYRGLQTFDEEHADYFFGRDADVQRLLEKLKTSRFLAVLGSSGSGKSSLVRAGLIPALKKGVAPGSERWLIRILTPGPHPLEALAAQIVRLDDDRAMNQTLGQLETDAHTLHLAVALAMADRLPTVRVVWVIDQCEEIFTLCQSDEERAQFIDNLLYAATIPEGRCVVVITMRADFYPRCAALPDFSSRVASQQFLVSPMDREGLRQCIEEPARRVGLELEQGLVGTILDDVGSQPGTLPLLEHALLELWERRRGYMLTLEGYRESGGVQGAIAQRADSIYLGFSPGEREMARRVMLRLTQPGEGTEDTRRRAPFRELVTHAVARDAVEAVVKDLAEARLLTVSGTDAGGDPLVDIAHEALIRSWPRLQTWLEDDRAALRVQHRVSEAAAEWHRLDHDDDVLFRGARLAEAQEWREGNEAALNDLERAFLDSSVGLREREVADREHSRLAGERLRRRITVGMGVGLLLAVLLGSLALVQWRTAEEQRQVADQQREEAIAAQSRAEQQRNVAFARQIAAQAEVVRNGRASLLPQSVALAAESLRRLPSVEAEQTLRRALALLARPVARMAHADYVEAVAFSPDGRLVATASKDHTARLWEASSGREVARLTHDDAVRAIAFSPDGRYLATASEDRTARLWESARGQELARLGHGDLVNAVAFSPDGRVLATASDDGSARLWSVASQEALARLPHSGQVLSLVFSADGRALATASADRTARVWDTASGEEVARVAHDRAVVRVAFGPDGSQIATASDDGTARLWDVSSSRETARFVHDREVTRVTFSGDGRFVATGSRDNTGRVWEVASRREVARLPHENALNALAFSPDGRYLATASTDATARVWDATTGRELTRMPHDTAVWAIAFSPNGWYLTTASVDGLVSVWEATSHRELVRLEHGAGVVAASFSPDGRRVATASSDRTARLWDAASGRELARLPHDHQVLAITFSPDGRYLASSSRDRTARVWDAASGAEIAHLTHGDEVIRAAFSPDGQMLATASDDGTARLWEAASGQELARLTHRAPVNRVILSPDGRHLATASEDNTALLYDVVERRELARLSHPDGPVGDIAYDPDGRYLATAGMNGSVRLWEIESLREVAQLSHVTFVSAVAFSPDGRYLSSATTDGRTRVWQVADMRELPPRDHDNAFVFTTGFSPDGRYLTTASGDRTARLWDAGTGAEVARFFHEREVVRSTFSPDGRYLVTASLDGTARIWRAEPEDLIATACAQLARNLSPETWRQHLGEEPYHKTCPNLED